MTIEMKKVWFDGEKVVTQNISASDIYKRHWDIASCKAYAEQLRDKNRANTAEHAAEAIEYLLTLAQPEHWSGVDFDIKTTPPQRTWVGLTNEDMVDCLGESCWDDVVRKAEAKLRSKNT